MGLSYCTQNLPINWILYWPMLVSVTVGKALAYSYNARNPLTLLQLIWWTIEKVAAMIKLQPTFCLLWSLVVQYPFLPPSLSIPAPFEGLRKRISYYPIEIFVSDKG